MNSGLKKSFFGTIVVIILVIFGILYLWDEVTHVDFELVNNSSKNIEMYIVKDDETLTTVFDTQGIKNTIISKNDSGSVEMELRDWVVLKMYKDTIATTEKSMSDFGFSVNIDDHLLSQNFILQSDSVSSLIAIRIDFKMRLNYSQIFVRNLHVTGHICDPWVKQC